MKNDIWKLSACDLVAKIREGSISCVEAAEASIGRMKEVNSRLNAVTYDCSEEAMVNAGIADEILKSGIAPGPLHGAPITVKENQDQKGTPTTNGLPALENNIAPDDSPVVSNLKKAGAVIIGRTNTPEFSLRITTDNPLRGLTLNPWDESVTCGGSSGGAASSVAAGIGHIALGNDVGGSLRYPAYCCGLSTVRPTLGRVPAHLFSGGERPPLFHLMAVQGIIAREVRDVRLGLRAASMGDPHDPWWVPVPFDGPPLELPIRVAVARVPEGYTVHPAIAEAVDQAAGCLANAGYKVEVAEAPMISEALNLWGELLLADVKAMVKPNIEAFGSETIKDLFEQYYQIFNVRDDFESYVHGFSERNRIAREWNLFLDKYPLVLTPLSLAPPMSANGDIQGVERLQELIRESLFLSSMNLLGLPAATAPTGLYKNAPIGVQIIGRRYREDTCLDAAEAVERSVGIMAHRLWEKMG